MSDLKLTTETDKEDAKLYPAAYMLSDSNGYRAEILFFNDPGSQERFFKTFNDKHLPQKNGVCLRLVGVDDEDH